MITMRCGWLIPNQKCFQFMLETREVHVLSQVWWQAVPHSTYHYSQQIALHWHWRHLLEKSMHNSTNEERGMCCQYICTTMRFTTNWMWKNSALLNILTCISTRAVQNSGFRLFGRIWIVLWTIRPNTNTNSVAGWAFWCCTCCSDIYHRLMFLANYGCACNLRAV